MLNYDTLNQQLHHAGIALSATELHGFLAGLICGGLDDQSWQPLLYQFTNDNHAYPTVLLNEVSEIYAEIDRTLADIDGFNFQLMLPEDSDVFTQADKLCEWANHFLLGLGLVQTQLDKEKGEVGEAIDDLHDICQLGYDEQDDKEELAEALEEIIEYVRTIAALFYTHFRPAKAEKPTIH
ncbi:YecA/YgfB family protein [Pasteurellaceae bacterium 22721_9_1]